MPLQSWGRPCRERSASLSVVATLAALLCVSALGGCDQRGERLVGVSSERDAMEVLVALEDAGIAGATLSTQRDSRQSSWVVSVPVESSPRARKALVERNLPREPKPGLAGMAATGGLIPTPTDERARLMAAMASDLERTLESITGVVQARVNVVLPMADPLGDPHASTGKASASVLVRYDPRRMALATSVQRPIAPVPGQGASPSAATTEADWAGLVRGMVSKGLAGFDADPDVLVTFTPVSLEAVGGPDGAAVQAARVPRSFLAIFIVVSTVALLGVGHALWWHARRRGLVGGA